MLCGIKPNVPIGSDNPDNLCIHARTSPTGRQMTGVQCCYKWRSRRCEPTAGVHGIAAGNFHSGRAVSCTIW
ncbi:hypothetical protein J6590_036716 [Homalodisca vitripennis]|nr:hypothetical protein J6590_036716 [Homalodisca vitripennis]